MRKKSNIAERREAKARSSMGSFIFFKATDDHVKLITSRKVSRVYGHRPNAPLGIEPVESWREPQSIAPKCKRRKRPSLD